MTASTLPRPELGNSEIEQPDVLAKSGGDAPQSESYPQLVWRRFRRSRISLVGGVLIVMLLVMAVFSGFFSPTDPDRLDMAASFTPPQRIHFVDEAGNFSLRPFVYAQLYDYDPQTFEAIWTDDTSQKYYLQFFVRNWEYNILGVIPADLHLFGVEEGGTVYLLGTDNLGRDLWGRACLAGRISLSIALFAALISVVVGSVVGVISGYYGGWVDGILQRIIEIIQSLPALALWLALAAIVPGHWNRFYIFIVMSLIFALIGWTVLAREVRGKVMAYRQTDFILAAKEMGASDARIIFRHLYPHSLSHVIVVLTLQIPEVILAEAFLSFLGIGIQEPLTSWGLLMRDAQNLETLGSHTWIMAPAAFIVLAVLGFNFLGDGLRDAVDPYAIV